MEQIFFFSVLLLACLFSWQCGGGPERIAALLLTIAALVSTLIAGHGSSMFTKIEWGLFGVDSVLALLLVWLALSVDRYWPMWLSALQLVSVLMHPAFGLSQNKMAFAYAIASIFWSYPMLFILVIGSIRQYRRVRKNFTFH
jgi:hypothetical protein